MGMDAWVSILLARSVLLWADESLKMIISYIILKRGVFCFAHWGVYRGTECY